MSDRQRIKKTEKTYTDIRLEPKESHFGGVVEFQRPNGDQVTLSIPGEGSVVYHHKLTIRQLKSLTALLEKTIEEL